MTRTREDDVQETIEAAAPATGSEGSPALEALGQAECLRLVASALVGRVAILDDPDAGPLVVPVNHRVDGRDIIFRTRAGSLLAAVDRSVVSFQADWIDPLRRSGWSVLVRGWGQRVSVREAEELGVTAWVGDAADHAVRLTPVEITGRRLIGLDLTQDAQGYL